MSSYSGLIWCQLDLDGMSRHGAWLIDMPSRMVSFTTDFPQHNATVINPSWPSVSEFILRVRLRVTIFCILALPHVTLGVTAKKVKCAYDCAQLQYAVWHKTVLTMLVSLSSSRQSELL